MKLCARYVLDNIGEPIRMADLSEVDDDHEFGFVDDELHVEIKNMIPRRVVLSDG